MEVKGRDLSAGLPKTLSIRSEEIREALKEPLSSILESIRITLERCPPELSADLVERGIVMAGGGACCAASTAGGQGNGLPVHIADDPMSAVAEGTGRVLHLIFKPAASATPASSSPSAACFCRFSALPKPRSNCPPPGDAVLPRRELLQVEIDNLRRENQQLKVQRLQTDATRAKTTSCASCSAGKTATAVEAQARQRRHARPGELVADGAD
jgi:hypothetical protein